MDIQTRKIEFVQSFLKLQNEVLISKLESILKENQAIESVEELKSFSIEELNLRIDKAENDFEEGRFKTTEELLAKY